MRTSEQNRKGGDRRKVLFAGLCLLCIAQPAHAYMDPGSMSVIITAILGAIAAVGYTARIYWDRFKSFVGRMFGREKPQQGEE
jgi:hypothetical protein